MSNKTYDRLKFLVQIFLPALAALYVGLSELWGLPSALEVAGTITLLTTFLGVLLRVSSNNYQDSGRPFDGALTLTPNAEGGFYFNFDMHPTQLPSDQDVVAFKVNRNTTGGVVSAPATLQRE